MTIAVEIVTSASQEILAAMHRLVPQLSSSATPMTMKSLNDIVTSTSVTLFIAREDALIQGTLSLVTFQIPSGVRAWIEDVIVEETVRGSGVGEKLARAAVDHAMTLGVRSIDLTSRPSREAANRLYRRIGFVERETNVYRFLVESPEDDSQ